ncbi:MAG: HRDC domain-containing protein [Acidimicrobiales bacterium]
MGRPAGAAGGTGPGGAGRVGGGVRRARPSAHPRRLRPLGGHRHRRRGPVARRRTGRYVPSGQGAGVAGGHRRRRRGRVGAGQHGASRRGAAVVLRGAEPGHRGAAVHVGRAAHGARRRQPAAGLTVPGCGAAGLRRGRRGRGTGPDAGRAGQFRRAQRAGRVGRVRRARITRIARRAAAGGRDHHRPGPSPRAGHRGRRATATGARPGGGTASGRHAALLQWRATRARLAAVAPAAVLDDATLAALADRPPTDEADLAGRPGVGPMRARRLAPALLATLAALP